MTEPENPDSPDSTAPTFDMVAAALRADSADVAAYARVLSETLGDTLPPGSVTVERERTVSDRMRGRPGDVRKITVRLGEQVMTLGMSRGGPSAEISHEVRGVVLSRQPTQLPEWADALARALVGHAAENARAAEALRRLVTGG